MKKYHSINGTYRKDAVHRFHDSVPKNQTCVATEKADGCNFSVQVQLVSPDKDIISYARREDILKPDESLVSKKTNSKTWQELMLEMKPNFNRAIDLIRETYPSATHVYFYGELIGPSVYTRVKYGEDLTFYGFDIYINENEDGNRTTDRCRYLDFNEMTEIYDAADIFRSIVIATGTLEELLAINPDIPSQIGIKLGATDANNISEGMVIIPTTNHYTTKRERCILKHKSSKFIDRQKQKVYKLTDNRLSSESQKVVITLLEFNTQNRLLDTMSKMPADIHRGKLGYAVLNDILETAKVDCNVDLKEFPQRKQIIAAVMKEILALIV